MTQEDFLKLAMSRWPEIEKLQNEKSFYELEKTLEKIWIELGREVLEKTISRSTADRRKKKVILTRFGDIDIAKSHIFSASVHGFAISPYMQDIALHCGQMEVYLKASELIEKLLRINIGPTQIHRLTNSYGKMLEESDNKTQPDTPPQSENNHALAEDEVLYCQMDGSMILTDNKYQEVKLGRIFSSSDHSPSAVPDRGGSIEKSLYVAHLGSSREFCEKLQKHLPCQSGVARPQNLVFITDGALWIANYIRDNFPQSTVILDFYHASEYLGKFSDAVFKNSVSRCKWLQAQKDKLLNSEVEEVINEAEGIPVRGAEAQLQKQKLLRYFRDNSYRMDYRQYQQRGLFIGSGAIEAANRTVVQKRLKLSGQRWTNSGAQNVLTLRAYCMSGRWDEVRHLITSQKVA